GRALTLVSVETEPSPNPAADAARLAEETPGPSTCRRGSVSSANGEPTRKPFEAEDELLRRAQRGDRESFAGLVAHYWDRLYRWLYHLTHNQHTAEDLVQETFLKAFAHLESFRRGSNFQAWLFRIAYNTFLNQRRTAMRMTRQPFPETLPADDDSPDELAI